MKTAIPLKKIQEKSTPRARSVALGMSIAWRSGFVVMGVTCGSTKSIQIKREERQRCFIVKHVLCR